MKKPLALLVVCLMCLALAAGFLLGDRSWERVLDLFGPYVIVPRRPGDVGHFGLAKVPEFSSDQYYFRDGFTDVDEYWSFCLPPDRAEAFRKAYIETNHLPLCADTDSIPAWVLGATDRPKWDGQYWFSDYRELDQVYYKKYLFLGYSAKRNRFYLMNWND